MCQIQLINSLSNFLQIIYFIRSYFGQYLLKSVFQSNVIITLAYSSMRNKEWGIWKQGISGEENRREKTRKCETKNQAIWKLLEEEMIENSK